jgi:hypothetical protein
MQWITRLLCPAKPGSLHEQKFKNWLLFGECDV